MGAEQQARGRIAGVFHGDDAAGAGQHPGNQVQRLLRAIAHHHVVVLAIDPTGERDVSCDGIAQRRQAFGQAVEALGTCHLPQGVGRAAPPVILGKLALAGGAADKVISQRAFQRRVAQKHRQRAPGLDHLETRELGMALLALDFGGPRIDVGAFADHPGEEVFVGQLRVGIGNGLAGNAQLLGQQAAGWKLCPGCQTARFDGAAQLLVQLARQVLAAIDDNM
ncbi:hypothetical protein D3C86_1637240 [compost metagenome]